MIPSVQLLILSKCICPISPISSHFADCIFIEMSLGVDKTSLRYLKELIGSVFPGQYKKSPNGRLSWVSNEMFRCEAFYDELVF